MYFGMKFTRQGFEKLVNFVRLAELQRILGEYLLI